MILHGCCVLPVVLVRIVRCLSLLHHFLHEALAGFTCHWVGFCMFLHCTQIYLRYQILHGCSSCLFLPALLFKKSDVVIRVI